MCKTDLGISFVFRCSFILGQIGHPVSILCDIDIEVGNYNWKIILYYCTFRIKNKGY